MITGIQILGVVFSLMMLYLTYVYYKRNNYGYRSAILWSLIWLGVAVLLLIPRTVYGIMQTLQIERTADFFVLGAALFFTLVIFYLYVNVKRLSRKIEELVRNEAINNAEVKKKKK